MTITERTLKRWRMEALKAKDRSFVVSGGYPEDAAIILFDELNERILRMTQELLDLHLIRK